jgi:hypothetical protein
MYHIVEVISSTKTKLIEKEEDLKVARKRAFTHSAVTGLDVEIQNETGKVIEHIAAWDPRDF